MSNIFLNKEEQGIVSFKFLKALPYGARLGICFSMMLIAFIIQAFLMDFFILGCILLFVSNLFLLVDGYDNRVKFGTFDPGSKWETVEKKKFRELIKMQNEMQKWDRSSTDCSNPVGCWLMFLLFIVCGGLIFIGITIDVKPVFIIGVDAAILLIPHWFTGLRRISMVIGIGLSKKIEVIENVLVDCKNELKEHDVDYYMLLSGKNDTKVPKDVKFKIDLKGHHPDFLGLYGQVVINNVQGTLYPYFYTVLVAKKGYGMNIQKGNVVDSPPPKLPGFFSKFVALPKTTVTKSLKRQKDVEVLVIRQTTTKQSGYHTNRLTAKNLLLTGIKSAEVNAFKN